MFELPHARPVSESNRELSSPDLLATFCERGFTERTSILGSMAAGMDTFSLNFPLLGDGGATAVVESGEGMEMVLTGGWWESLVGVETVGGFLLDGMNDRLD